MMTSASWKTRPGSKEGGTIIVHVNNFSHAVNRGKKLKVFICGDYEFETRTYGLSGASGKSLFTYMYLVKIYIGIR